MPHHLTPHDAPNNMACRLIVWWFKTSVLFNLIVGTTLMAIVILKVWRVWHHHHLLHLHTFIFCAGPAHSDPCGLAGGGYTQVQSRLKEVSQTVISKEHLIRLTGLIVGYWFLYAFFTFYRVYEETVAVRGTHNARARHATCDGWSCVYDDGVHRTAGRHRGRGGGADRVRRGDG
jgi:hypothetical protein